MSLERDAAPYFIFVIIYAHLWNVTQITIWFSSGPSVALSETPPVSMLSLMMQFPVSRAASQCITQPCEGTTITSPGTRCSVGIVSSFPVSPRITVTTSEECTVLRRFRWFWNTSAKISQHHPVLWERNPKCEQNPWPSQSTSFWGCCHKTHF